MEFLEYWRLCERPFEPAWDARFFYQSRAHNEALHRLDFVAGEQSMLLGMLTGDIGCGKTLTRAVFSGLLDQRQFRVVTQENSSFGFNDLLGLTLRALNGGEERAIGRSKAVRWELFQRAVEGIAGEGRHLVLIFDEAQEMSASTLNELKQLTNLNGGGRHWLTLILVGQPELREKVARLPAINQRISLRFHLDPFAIGDTAEYLRHRLLAAGHETGELFTPDAVEQAHAAARGIPRELNRIAKLALEFAWLHEYPEVTNAAVDAVARDMKRHQPLAIA